LKNGGKQTALGWRCRRKDLFSKMSSLIAPSKQQPLQNDIAALEGDNQELREIEDNAVIVDPKALMVAHSIVLPNSAPIFAPVLRPAPEVTISLDAKTVFLETHTVLAAPYLFLRHTRSEE